MKLTLRNLGRLREATIDLGKDLIVLTGPNNTSKTYVAHAIYGFGEDILPDLSFALEPVLDAFIAEKPRSAGALEINMVDFVERYRRQALEAIALMFREGLADILASHEEFVARTQVELEVDEEQLARARRTLIDHGEEFDAPELTMSKVAGKPVWTFELLPSLSAPARQAREELLLRAFALDRIAEVFATALLGFPRYMHVLTAERAAIQLFSRELSLKRTELVDELLKLKSGLHRRAGAERVLGETLEQRAQRYPLAIQDSLLIANDLATHKARNSFLAPLADQLEHGLLGGSIRLDDDGEMSFHPNESDTGLSLHLSSSSVKSLAGLSFYLRHIAEKGQFLIIDEPELNLHPDNQRRVARVLARLVRSGIKVLISTHSDYIIRELNNLIMLSADKDGSVRQRLGYDEEETLAPSQVGAYLFDPERANPIEVTPTGIEVATIEREINALNSVSQDIYFSLFNKIGE